MQIRPRQVPYRNSVYWLSLSHLVCYAGYSPSKKNYSGLSAPPAEFRDYRLVKLAWLLWKGQIHLRLTSKFVLLSEERLAVPFLSYDSGLPGTSSEIQKPAQCVVVFWLDRPGFEKQIHSLRTPEPFQAFANSPSTRQVFGLCGPEVLIFDEKFQDLSKITLNMSFQSIGILLPTAKSTVVFSRRRVAGITNQWAQQSRLKEFL